MIGEGFAGIDPASLADVERMSAEVITPSIDRNFGDQSAEQFNAGIDVVKPVTLNRLPGETAVQAHVRLQAEKGTNE